MKLRHLAAVGALCLGVSLAAGSASALGFVNGSFETGDLTGWSSSAGFGLNPFGTAYGSGMDGTYWHWLAGYEGPITTSQTISGLTAGTTYAVKFIMASEFTNADSLRISVNGGPGSLFSAPAYVPGGFNGGFWDNWVAQKFQFTASSGSATIQFDTVGLNQGGYDVGLDNVSISVAGGVPEPMTWAMMLVGFAGLGAVMRANRRADRELAALAG